MNPLLDIPDADSLRRFVTATGESEAIDFKAPCTWDGAETKASIAKDVIAFANSEGGGALVIGRSQNEDGSFAFDGLEESLAGSFDTTKVAAWINSHFAPSVSLLCATVLVDNKRFVVIKVQEFAETPAVCVKESGAWRDTWHLKPGAIFVRGINGESKPLSTPEELSKLIGRAVLKRRDVLQTIFDAALAGNLAPREPTDEEQFDKLAKRMLDDLRHFSQTPAQPGWSACIHPRAFEDKMDDECRAGRCCRSKKVWNRSQLPARVSAASPNRLGDIWRIRI